MSDSLSVWPSGVCIKGTCTGLRSEAKKKRKKKNINTGLRQGTNSYSVYDTKMFILFFADLVRVIKQ